ncbi:MAG: peptide chain release factor N(5)-glutamine methyltransferase [Caldisericaceae bacterium]
MNRTIKELTATVKKELESVSDAPDVEAYIILSFVLGIPKERLYAASADYVVNSEMEEKISRITQERERGFPLFYITGRKEFMGIEFEVDESVLIPRPETETLVEEALKASDGKPLNVLDIGTGSGCIILSFLHLNEQSRGTAIDISESALTVARKNAKRLSLESRVQFVLTDFRAFNCVHKFDLILSNPPYVKTDLVKAIKFEPIEALDGGKDGLAFYPVLIKKSFELLNPSGRLILEIDEDMGTSVSAMFEATGFTNNKVIKDLRNVDRFISGEKI